MTGDWNLSLLEWRSYLQKHIPNHICENTQVVRSTMLRECKHGDVTIAINCQAFQVEGPDWTKFSNPHDVVIPLVCLEATHTSTPEPQVGASAVQPATQASVQIAKQVADQRAAERATAHNMQTAKVLNSPPSKTR